jgi:hypothetical protein
MLNWYARIMVGQDVLWLPFDMLFTFCMSTLISTYAVNTGFSAKHSIALMEFRDYLLG